MPGLDDHGLSRAPPRPVIDLPTFFSVYVPIGASCPVALGHLGPLLEKNLGFLEASAKRHRKAALWWLALDHLQCRLGLIPFTDPCRDPEEGVAHKRRGSALDNDQSHPNVPCNMSLEYDETQGIVIISSSLHRPDSKCGPGPAALTSPGNLFRPQPGPAESDCAISQDSPGIHKYSSV